MPGMAILRKEQRRGNRTGWALTLHDSDGRIPKPLLIKGFFLAEHVVDRPTQLGRQDRERFGGTTFLLLLLLPFAGPFAGAQKQARRLTEGPTQMGVADLLRSRAELLARRLVGATHQPGVGEELADVLETRHIVQFVQQHQGENRADAGNAAQTVIALGVVYLDGAGQVKLGGADEFIELVDQIEIQLDVLADTGIAEAFRNLQLRAVAGEGQLLGKRRQVALAVEDLHVGGQSAALVHQIHAPTQQVARFAHALGVDVRERERPAPQQARDLAGVDAVVLGLAAVDGFHVQGVPQHERNLFLPAHVREPVPAEHALDADDDAVTKGRDRMKKGFRVAGEVVVEDDVAVVIEDAQIHRSCVQVDAAVESMGLRIETHGMVSLGWVEPERGSWLESTSFLKLPRRTRG